MQIHLSNGVFGNKTGEAIYSHGNFVKRGLTAMLLIG